MFRQKTRPFHQNKSTKISLLKWLLLITVLLSALILALLRGELQANLLHLRLEKIIIGRTEFPPNICWPIPSIVTSRKALLDQGLAELQKSIQSNYFPDMASAWRWLGQLSLLANDLIGAQSAFQTSLNFDDDAIARMQLGILAASQGQTVTAAAVFKGVGYSPDGLVQLGNKLLGVDRQYEEALNCYSVAVEMNPASYKALLGKGRSLQMLERNSQALDVINQALQFCSTPTKGAMPSAEFCENVFQYHGEIRNSLGYPEEQVETDFRIAYQFTPNSFGAELLWVNWLVSRGRFVEALIPAEKLLRDFPEKIEPYGLIVHIYLAEGKVEDAKALIKQALQKFPDSHSIRDLNEQTELQP